MQIVRENNKMKKWCDIVKVIVVHFHDHSNMNHDIVILLLWYHDNLAYDAYIYVRMRNSKHM